MKEKNYMYKTEAFKGYELFLLCALCRKHDS